MSIGSISDVLTRISGIEQQLQSLQSGTLLDSPLGISDSSSTSPSGATAASSSTSSDSASSADFANELAAAEQGDTSDTAGASTLDDTASGSGTTFGSLDNSALGSSYASGLLNTTSTSGVALASSASSQLTSGQQQFASTLSADTGLNPNVVSAWLLAEESGDAAQSRQSANNNDWLNIGYTDSATFGAGDSIWSDPTSAANATAAWLKGENSIPGYGTASPGIQSILSNVGQTPAAQIQAIQASGWSSGGYPSLESLYQTVTSG